MRISDWSSDVCSSDLLGGPAAIAVGGSLLAAAQAGAFANIPLLADIEPWRIVLLLFAVSSLLLPLALLTIREPPRGAATNVDSPEDLAWFVYASAFLRSEARRVGNECVSTWRSRGSPDLEKKKEQ